MTAPVDWKAEAERLESEVARLEALVYVPGLWKCAKCKLTLISSTLHVNVGMFSANKEPQKCANGCGPMWRVTERDAGNELIDRMDAMKAAQPVAPMMQAAVDKLAAEVSRLQDLISTPELEDFDKGVPLECAHQVERWGEAHDRSKSAENWYWLIGYLGGKALRAAIAGDRQKALHHTISAAAALRNWHAAILRDTTSAGVGDDPDLVALDGGVDPS